jgi:hypothetical protein
VHQFASKLLESEAYLQKVLAEMKFNQNDFETTIIASKKSISKEAILEPKGEEKNSYNSI